MTVTINTIYRLDPNHVFVRWTSDLSDPTYRIWQDGRLIAETTANTFKFADSDGSSAIEILDDESASQTRPRKCVLNWYRIEDADHYRIEEYVDSAWVLRAKIKHTTQGYYIWYSRVLEDETTHNFRVRAVDAAGNQSDALSLTFFIVRIPDAPSATYSVNPTSRVLTVDATDA